MQPAVPLSFGHAALARRLVSELEASLRPGAGSSTEPALVIGVFGEWGAGKSRLLQTVGDELDKRSQKNGEQVLTVVVPFNAWRFEREEHLLVPLLRVAQQCLRKAIDDSLGTDIKRHERLSDQLMLLGDLAQVIYQHGGRDLAQAALTAHGVALKLPAIKPAEGKPNPGALEVLELRRRLRANARRLDTPISQLQSLYYDFLEQLKAVTGRNPSALTLHRQRLLRRGTGLWPALRFYSRTGWDWFFTGEVASAPGVQVNLVFLVDDLDRCLPDKAVEVLEAIKLFLEVEGCAFVLALDEEVIERGIAHRYRDYALQGKEGMTPITGAEYLEKLVHLPVRLPRPTGAAARDFLADKWPAWFADASAQANDLATLVAAITPGVPRKLHRMTSLLALAESLGAGDAKTPRKREWLAIVCALQLFAPALYRYLRLHGARLLITLADWRTDALFRDVAGLRKALQLQVLGVDSPAQLQYRLVLQRLPDLCEAAMHNRSGFDLLELLARVGELHEKAALTGAQLGALMVFTEVEGTETAAGAPAVMPVAPDAATAKPPEAAVPAVMVEMPAATAPVAPPAVAVAMPEPVEPQAGGTESDEPVALANAPQEARLENERALVEAVNSGELELVRVALSREGAALRDRVLPASLWSLLSSGRLMDQLRAWVDRGAPADATQFLLQELRPHLSQAAALDLLRQFGTPVLKVLKRPDWAAEVRAEDGTATLLTPPLRRGEAIWLPTGPPDAAATWAIPRGWVCPEQYGASQAREARVVLGSDAAHGVYARLRMAPLEGYDKALQHLRWVPAGKFAMGSPNGPEEEGELRTVTLSRGFWIADTTCSWAFWRRLGGRSVRSDDGSFPVVGVTAAEVEEVLARLARGLPDCEIQLPSEAEWEAACRAGTRTAYAFSDQPGQQRVHAEADAPLPVAAGAANFWGLRQMHGNVAELCRDLLAPEQRSAEAAWVDPEGRPGADTGWHALRGGSFRSRVEQTRSAAVDRIARDQRRDDVGFRFILRAQAAEGQPPA